MNVNWCAFLLRIRQRGGYSPSHNREEKLAEAREFLRSVQPRESSPHRELALLPACSHADEDMDMEEEEMGNRYYLGGRRLEHRVSRELRKRGLLVVRSAGSRSIFDLIAFSRRGCLCLQVKRRPTRTDVWVFAKTVRELIPLSDTIRAAVVYARRVGQRSILSFVEVTRSEIRTMPIDEFVGEIGKILTEDRHEAMLCISGDFVDRSS